MTSETSSAVLRYTAFTSDPSGGNPAGVVLDASGFDDARMLAVAAEVGYSETAFVTVRDAERRRFAVRYFSPLAEVDFCGHATVATAVALAERVGPGELVFETQVGEIPVATAADADGVTRATLTSVATDSHPVEDSALDAALAALGWQRSELDPGLPPRVAFGGVWHLVLAVASRARLADLSYDFDGLAGLMRARGWTTLQLVWQEAPGRFHSRNPFPVGGVVEDPATGAAAAAFGGYLRALGRVPEGGEVVIRQGEDMGRPSTLTLAVDAADPRVRVSGRAVSLV
ncbi:PhzF family phenazine biosynthesis isomerase [Streptomyces sp. NPDC087658]|uniref:PhzF family phenazine biosynthesis isomerase n=1 Tax=Streptomyces sp. NPDC087658 TaxID=3365800 RepID=UPI0037FEC51F